MFINYKLIILLAAQMLFIIAIEGKPKKKKCMTLCRPGGMWYNGCNWCPCTKSGRRGCCPKTDKPCHYHKSGETTSLSTEVPTDVDDSVSRTTAELENCSTKDMTDIEINSDGEVKEITEEITTSSDEASEITDESQLNTVSTGIGEHEKNSSVNTVPPTIYSEFYGKSVNTDASQTDNRPTDNGRTDNGPTPNSFTTEDDSSGIDNSTKASDGPSEDNGPVSEGTDNASAPSPSGERVTGDYTPSDDGVGSDASEASNSAATGSPNDGVTPDKAVSDGAIGSNVQPASNGEDNAASAAGVTNYQAPSDNGDGNDQVSAAASSSE